MKKLKKGLSVLVAAAMTASLMVPALAADTATYKYSAEAQSLYDLGLYNGTDPEKFVPDLGSSLTREQGMALIVRLLGKEEVAKAMSADDVKKALVNFKDASKVNDSLKNTVAYAIANKLVNGVSATSIGPKSNLIGKMYATIILRALGHTADYDNATTQLQKIGGLTEEEAKAFSTKNLIRDDAVGISFGSLAATYSDSKADAVKTVISELIKAGVKGRDGKALTNDSVMAAGAMPVKSVTAIADITTAKGVSPTLPKTVEVTFTNGTKKDVAVTWDTVDVTTEGTKAVSGTIEKSKVKATVNVVVGPDVLTFVSATASNLKEVVVNFNGPVDATKGADKANYTVKVGTTDQGVALATLSEDKKSATLTLTNSFANQSDVVVTVKTGVGLAAEASKTITAVTDTTLPVADSITLTGPKTFDIKFSEPVKVTGSEAVVVKDGIYGIASKVLSTDCKTLTVTLGTSLADGKYPVKVSGYADFANFGALAKTFDLDYKKDTAAPTVTLKSASQTEVVVVFNKAVTKKSGGDLDANYFYHTFTAYKPQTVTTTDKKEFKLTFFNTTTNTGNALPAGAVIVTVLKTVDTETVVDLWGNALAEDAKLTATITADLTAPTITKVEATAEDKIAVTYSESVNSDSTTGTNSAKNPANYTIKDKDAKAVSVTISTVDYASADNKATLNLSGKLAGGKYTVEVKNVQDTALAKNTMATVSKEFEVTDKTAPSISAVSYVYKDALTPTYLYVTFSENMKTSGDGSALTLANYYQVDGGGVASAMPDNTTIAAFGSDAKYKITIPAGKAVPSKLFVNNVQDVAGNKYISAAATSINADVAPVIYKVTTKELGKLEVEVRGRLQTVSADGLRVTVATGTYTAVAIDTMTYKTEDSDTIKDHTVLTVSLIAAGNLANPSEVPSKVEVVANKLTSDTGTPMDAKVYLTADVVKGIVDGIAPKFVAPTKDTVTAAVYNAGDSKKILVSNEYVVLKFDENTTAFNSSVAAQDLVITFDGKVLVPDIDYYITNLGSQLIEVNFEVTSKKLSDKDFIAGKVMTIKSVDAPKYLNDGSSATGNKITSTFSQEYTLQ